MSAPLRAPLLASCPRRRAALMDGPLVRPRHGDLFTEGHGGHLEVRLESRRSRMAAGGARGRSGRLWVGRTRALRCLDRADAACVLRCCPRVRSLGDFHRCLVGRKGRLSATSWRRRWTTLPVRTRTARQQAGTPRGQARPPVLRRAAVGLGGSRCPGRGDRCPPLGARRQRTRARQPPAPGRQQGPARSRRAWRPRGGPEGPRACAPCLTAAPTVGCSATRAQRLWPTSASRPALATTQPGGTASRTPPV